MQQKQQLQHNRVGNSATKVLLALSEHQVEQ